MSVNVGAGRDADISSSVAPPADGSAGSPRADDAAAWRHALCALRLWRHPKPCGGRQGLVGRCIGHTDLPVDRRKAKRLAHRIRRHARRQRGARVVFTSPLQRGATVGRWLRAWGWQHHIDPRLSEMDFGAWDGRRWDDIGPAAVDAWCADFADHRAGGGESVSMLLARCAAFLAQTDPAVAASVVGHAGWISAARWMAAPGRAAPSAAAWPAAVSYGRRVAFPAES